MADVAQRIPKMAQCVLLLQHVALELSHQNGEGQYAAKKGGTSTRQQAVSIAKVSKLA